MADARPAAGRRLLLMLRTAVWVALAVFLVLLARKLDFRQLRAVLAGADVRLLALTVLAGLPGSLMMAARWSALASEVRPVSLLTTFAAQSVSYAASAVLPLRAGEAVRVELLARASGMGRAEAAGTVALDHTVNGIVMFAFAAALPALVPVPLWMSVVIWGGMAGAIALALVMLRLAQKPSLRERGRIQQIVARLRGGLVGLRNPRAVLPAAGWAVGAWSVEIFTTMIALAAFHLPHDAAHAMAVLFGVNLALAVPAPPANLGNYELGAAMALVAFGGPKEHAAAFALGLHGLQLVSTLVLGAVFLPRFRRPTAGVGDGSAARGGRPTAGVDDESAARGGRPTAGVGDGSAARGGRPTAGVGDGSAARGDQPTAGVGDGSAARGGRPTAGVGDGSAARGGRPTAGVGDRSAARGGRPTAGVGDESAARGDQPSAAQASPSKRR